MKYYNIYSTFLTLWYILFRLHDYYPDFLGLILKKLLISKLSDEAYLLPLQIELIAVATTIPPI